MPRISKKERVRAFASARGWKRIGEAEWHELKAVLPEVSDAIVRSSGIEIAQPWCGISQHTPDELEQSLVDYSEIYSSRPDLRRYCRKEVIAAKDRARWISKSTRIDKPKRTMKAEMVDWMLVWLGDPAMFPTWIRARRLTMLNDSTQVDDERTSPSDQARIP